MAGYKATYEDLEDLSLRDQYFVTCDQGLKTFLKEKGKLSLKDMTKFAGIYIEAHEYSHNDVKKSNNKAVQKMTEKHDKPQNEVNAQQSNASCSNCGMNIEQPSNGRLQEK